MPGKKEKAPSKRSKKNEGIKLPDADAKERKQDEEKQFFNEYLVDQLRDMAFWTWADGRIFFVNEEACRSLGYTRCELLSMNIPDIDVDFTAEKLSEFIERNKHLGKILVESRFKTKDGKVFPVEISSNYFHADGKEYMVSLCRDISERKKTDEALRESERRLKRTERILYRSQEAGKVGSWHLDLRNNDLWWSPETYRIFGLPPNTGLSYEDFLAIVYEEDRAGVDRAWKEALAGKPYEIEHRVFANGQVKWVYEKAIIDFDAHGTPMFGIGTVVDITERKRAENAIVQSKIILQLVMDNVPQAIFWKDRNSTYLGCNKIFARAAGLKTPEDIRGKTDYDLPWSREQADSFREHDFRVMESDTPEYHIIEQQREASGRVAWLETSKVPLHDLEGNVTGILCTYEDITERKLAEEAVRLASAYNRSLIEASLDPLVTISPAGVITDVNKATEMVTGFAREELINTDFCDYFTEPDRAKEGYRTAFERGSVTDYALEIWHKDGHITPVIYNASVYRDDTGEVIGVFAAARDITERRQAEEALKKSEANLERAQRIAALGNWEWDLKTDQLSGSREYFRMFGLDHQEAVPFEKFARMLHPDDRKWVNEAIKDIRYDNLPRDYEFRILLPDGKERYIHSIVEVILDENGRPIKVFGTMQDISERKRAQNALQDAKDQVELYVDLMGHDINNMNQISLGFLELAHNIIEMEGKLGEDNIVLLDRAMDSLNNSSQLIDSVRKLQREKMGLYEPEVLSVGSIIEDTIKQFKRIPGRDVKITCNAPGDYRVRANVLLKDVFTNLVGNAVKHSKGALVVNIGVSRVIDNGKIYCRIDVEDDGPGIPDTLKSTLFDRLSLTTTRAKGKGFGLCLIKMLVDDYRGKFWVEDRVAGDYTRGARFVVMLPAVE
ncbi:putative histidine kinase [Methanocella paludicola SANAE]|uniref:histidine kinase n=1 Tax=Methanocella paludicola (strain DSM 17711 / JCM 13418 / NBRC 101707 / SANAE) TaxID=304371 RepID=D1YZK9_METPS|nr:PAS domain S-box protein [Methanocella paludicola]BAI61881.1 putative histidine kinase [Methanocella paludicola SANAE]